MQIILTLRTDHVRDLLNDPALVGDVQERLNALLRHRYEEENTQLSAPRPLREILRELLNAYCTVAIRNYTKAFTFDEVRKLIRSSASATDPTSTMLFDGIPSDVRQRMYSGMYLPILKNCFTDYVVNTKPSITIEGVIHTLSHVAECANAYVVHSKYCVAHPDVN